MTHMLIGKTITEIKIADDKKAILFVCKEGAFKACCVSPCCSETWIENVDLPALGFPALVITAEELYLGEEDIAVFDVIKFYGCKITTNKGEIIIDFRNSSNGEYGGELLWTDIDQCYTTENWIDIPGSK